MDIEEIIEENARVYNLLKSLPLGLDFYKNYNEYSLNAKKIEDVLKVDKQTVKEEVSAEDIFNPSSTLFNYINFKVVRILNSIFNKKDELIIKMPGEESQHELLYYFLKLSRKEDDVSLWYWFHKTDKVFNEFLDEVETTEAGNKLFVETGIMNVMHKIKDLIDGNEEERVFRLSYIERINENNNYGHHNVDDKLGKPPRYFDERSLDANGKAGYIEDLNPDGKPKEYFMQPVDIFQSLVISRGNKAVKSEKVKNLLRFDDEFSILIIGELTFRLTRGKNIYYILKYIFSREDVYEECFYDEITSESELDHSKKYADKYLYDALSQFNKRLAGKGESEVFLVGLHSIRISSLYRVDN